MVEGPGRYTVILGVKTPREWIPRITDRFFGGAGREWVFHCTKRKKRYSGAHSRVATLNTNQVFKKNENKRKASLWTLVAAALSLSPFLFINVAEASFDANLSRSRRWSQFVPFITFFYSYEAYFKGENSIYRVRSLNHPSNRRIVCNQRKTTLLTYPILLFSFYLLCAQRHNLPRNLLFRYTMGGCVFQVTFYKVTKQRLSKKDPKNTTKND